MTACTNTPKEEEPPSKPVPEEPAQPSQAAPPADPTAGWRLPSGDTKLPTESQLADGAESSIGSGSPAGTTDNTAPSTSVKPPSNAPEDQLDADQ
ncbi:hypothetical protein HW115_08825 [Verrucomicrobiaceae bacterium N1E253]|uniref:Uncharacterized protein n=2 Tax=Oceaniferula marina TaxID=2748318 RepID=A0A851GIK8_9BACT|nr:hypothetical protein [Oceaniferula marina]